MSIDNLIDSLKNLDLSTYPEKEIRYLLQQIGKIPAIELTFHKGKEIMRARPNENEKIRYRRKSNFSYKPQEKNDKYQRASTPYRTMFYATCLSENLNDKNISMRITPTLESIHKELYDNNSSFYKKISYGRWIVMEDLKLFPIIHNSNFCNKTSYLKEMKDYYNNVSIEFNCPQDLIEKSNKILSYLADEFAKEEIREHYDYMISAIFSELVTENCFDGIFYPSVRVDGEGFNIAITPKATEKLRLIFAGECTIYKHKMNTRVGNDAYIILNGNEEEFDMIDEKDRENQELRLVNDLGFNSIEDFRDYCNRNN